MISYETYCTIVARSKQGLNAAQIARELGIHPGTVSKWIEAGCYRPRRSRQRSSKLDPFKPHIVRWLNTHSFSATHVFQRLKEMQYTGGISIVRDYVRSVRPLHLPAFLTVSFEPGESAQVDWGEWGR